jgi:SNF2 family DNA or RNA helicase
MSLGKHAYGLNLQQYTRIIFFDKTWDYAQREQVEHRIYREGQTDDSIYYDLTSNAGLDSLINQNIKKKTNMLQIFKQLTNHELKELL